MATQTQENQEIEQAIERLSQKMRTVSDAMELARTPVKKTAANQNKAKNGKNADSKFFKSLLLLSLFAGLSYMLASLVSVYIEQVKTKQTQEVAATAPAPASSTPATSNTLRPLPARLAATSQAGQESASAPLPSLTPIIADSALPTAPPIAPAPAIADFALKAQIIR